MSGSNTFVQPRKNIELQTRKHRNILRQFRSENMHKTFVSFARRDTRKTSCYKIMRQSMGPCGPEISLESSPCGLGNATVSL